MELKGSLPHTQEPSTGPYLEPAQSAPYHLIPFGTISTTTKHLNENSPLQTMLNQGLPK
jgi:hypothetical protein